ncbi:MATE family efflux transporter [Tepidibacter thalassicus]|uniref:Multidrug export protein MepA n=1 Tax=Tepidibacter thalassicus DSM 15285 TaxID=1123350 RepID=A0A1M5QJX6_9FIRM|nr:MATE family efflux transporter [Tepidibacter thalassicus]SHH14424.1 putative efflux protein, MATE family [Tepidibacter thalassicus DSM 15285]
MDEKREMMGNEPINKLLIKFSVPAIIGMIVNALYNIVDGIFIGQGVGPLALGGLTIAMPIMLVMMAIAFMVGTGAASAISRKIGEKNIEGAQKVLGEAIFLNLIINSIVTIIIFIFMDKLLILFGATELTINYARDYMSVIAYGIVLNSFAMSTNNYVRAEGNAKVAMITMIVGAVINIILDAVFIFALDMGIKGAALATVIAQIFSAIWLLLYYIKGDSILKIKISNFKLTKENVKEIIMIGMAAFFRQIAGSVLMVIVNRSLIKYGSDYHVVVLGIINRFFMFMFMPLFGIAQGFQPIAGFNYGAKKFDRVQECFKYASLYASIQSVVAFLVMFLFPKFVISIFTNDVNTINIGVNALEMMIWGLPFIGFQIIGSTLFQAIGKGVESLILTMSRQIILLIPLVLILPLFIGVKGIYYSYPISDILSTVITFILVVKENKIFKLDEIQGEF